MMFEDKGGEAIYPYLTPDADDGQGKHSRKGGRTVRLFCCAALLLGMSVPGIPSARGGDETADLQAILSREIIGPRQAMAETQAYIEARIPRMKTYSSAATWEPEADRLRHEILDRVVFRGKAAEWRRHKVRVEWFDTIPGGPGYRIKKLRYEPLPGLWIPALLYEPENLAGRVPAILNVNGHDGNGKASTSKSAASTRPSAACWPLVLSGSAWGNFAARVTTMAA